SGTRKIVPAHVTLPTKPDRPRAHVIALAGCEGDAVLIAGWAGDHLAELENEMQISAVAITWLSDDCVPVGHMPWGKLEPVVVLAEVWVILAPTVLLEHGRLAKRLLASAAAAGLGRIVVTVDVPERNVHRLAPPPKHQPEESLDEESLDPVPVERIN